MKTLIGITLLALVACSHQPSKQLIDARNAYQAAASGPAGTQTPADLYEARKMLDRADAEFATNGNSPEAHDLAYIAQRKAQLATARARIVEERLRFDQLTRQAQNLKEQRFSTTRRDLEQTRQRLEEERRAAEASAQLLASRERELETERQARAEVESKLDKAMKDLSTVAAVKEEQRGTVITLSGSVLFAPGQSTLLSTAQGRLDQVAESLKEGVDGQRITVEGHTDSVGSAAANDQLSTLRAMAVREYLIQRGVPAGQINARGWGEARPVTDNSTAENRAHNRRVEIVIEPKPVS